ncbi:MAG: O-antigen ligase family protein [Selenomonadaceae bacterium]|nr:O-antigen ligase family protein [Selenomonadaceae bacterium]
MKNIETVEKIIFYSMCGFFLVNLHSTALGNAFLAVGLVLTVYRLWLKHDDIPERFTVGKKCYVAFSAFWVIVLSSCFLSGDVTHCLSAFFKDYVFKVAGFLIIMVACYEKRRLLILIMIEVAVITFNGFAAVYAFLMFNQRTGGQLAIMVMAGLLSIVVPVLISATVLTRGKKCLISVASVAFFAIVAVANGTRGAWVAIVLTAFISVCFMMESWKKRVLVVLVSVLLVAGSVMSGGYVGGRVQSIFKASDRSSMERFYLWQSAYNMFDDNKVLGVGLSRFGGLYKKKYILPEARQPQLYHAHSNVFMVLAECGGLGLIALLALWGQMVWFGLGGWLKTRQFAYIAFFCITSGLFIQGLTEYNMGNTAVMKFFWCSLAVCMQLININAKSELCEGR